MALLHRSRTVVNRTVEYRSSRLSRLWGYAAKVYWHKVLGLSCSAEKGATAPFSCLPARTGPGSARKWVKGLVPCRFLGQRPKPSESFLELISAIFKVHLSLFLTHFFIGYLTLPLWKDIKNERIKKEIPDRMTESPWCQCTAKKLCSGQIFTCTSVDLNLIALVYE